MGYNQLWCIAFNYGATTNMTSQRLEQFAADYAQVFEDEDVRCSPEEFNTWAACNDFHYHDQVA